MAKLFLSHSSKDKLFVKKLAIDLKTIGHSPWLDEWEIKVGDCILSRIESGLDNADYLILVLSKSAIKSGWVEREWKTKYWEEVNENNIILLPVLIDDCKLPVLLKTKKYADFRINYKLALKQLIDVLPTPNNCEEKYTRNKEINIIDIVEKRAISEKFSGHDDIENRRNIIEQCIITNDLGLAIRMIVKFVQDYSKNKTFRREALLHHSSINALQDEIRKYGRTSELDIRQKKITNSLFDFIEAVVEENNGGE